MLNPSAKPYKYQKPSLLPSFYAPPPPPLRPPLVQLEQQLLLPPELCSYLPFLQSQYRPCLKDRLIYVYHTSPPPFLPSLPPLPSFTSNHNYTTTASASAATSTATTATTTKDVEVSDTSPETSKIKKGCGITRRVVAGSFKGLGRRSFLGYSRGKNYGLMWKPKVESKIDEGFGGVFSSPFDVNGNESTLLGQTTVMIKNIPNKFSREMLLDLLDKHCLGENEKAQLSSNPCLSAYDFVYLPMDFRNRCNLGYAFVNFTSTVAASRLCRSFHNYRWQVFDTKKICEIRDAKIQGKAALMGHFRSSYFKCDTDDFLPVEFSPARNGSTSCTPPSIVGKRTAFL